MDKTYAKGIHIGDYTAVSFRTSILTHDFINGRHVDTYIGSHCFVGAGSTIMPGVRVGDHAIVGSGSVVLTDVPPHSVVSGNPARIVERNIVTGKWGIRNPKFLAQEGIVLSDAGASPSVDRPVAESPAPLPVSAPPASAPRSAPGSIDAMRSYFGDTALDTPFADSGWDSFALIGLRAEIEENEGRQIRDEDWIEITRPSDLARFITRPKAGTAVPAVAGGAQVQRSIEINMPQMSQKGLSESWLFKEIGDIHWSLITGALGVKSNAIADQEGRRLYATFTRIRYDSSVPLSEYLENDRLDFTATMTRFGGGMFFSRITASAGSGQISFDLMSSFSKFGSEGNNRSLLKGQPAIPADFAIPSVSAFPQFAEDYKDRRALPVAQSLFTTDYEIVPVHDINGVGLLYFAAYPLITDICMQRHVGKGRRLSPQRRDICYFANSGSDEAIRFELEQWDEDGDRVSTKAHLIRADDTRMATVFTDYTYV